MRGLTGLIVVLFALVGCARTSNSGTPASEAGVRAPVVCSGVPCAMNEFCCLTTGRCFDPSAGSSACSRDGRPSPVDAGGSIVAIPDGASPDAGGSSDGSSESDAAVASPDVPPAVTVAVPGDPPPNTGTGTECSSDHDCTVDEYCAPRLCLGPGRCRSRLNCGWCSTDGSGGWSRGAHQPPTDPPPGTDCQVCGCNGVTYAAPQIACRMGAIVSGSGACGEPAPTGGRSDAGPSTMRPRIRCGNDSQCPADQSCCAIWGLCMDRSCTTCCRYAPPGASFPCRDDFDCLVGMEYCAGSGCGTPGGCMRPRSGCGGVLEPVCGCNGRTYVKACAAGEGLTRVAASGECP